MVQDNPALWRDTAILITFDELGANYDLGFIQPIDFFGDGPRTVMIAVSRFAKPGHVDHTYSDHASILKFIEYNWGLKPLSSRSRDNLPNPGGLAAGTVFSNQQPRDRRSDGHVWFHPMIATPRGRQGRSEVRAKASCQPRYRSARSSAPIVG